MSTQKPIDRVVAPNGVVVEFWDETEPYGYANLLRAAVRMRATVPGVDRPFEQRLHRIGVAKDDVEDVVRGFVDRLRENLGPYLSRPEFVDRFRNREALSRSRVVRFPVTP